MQAFLCLALFSLSSMLLADGTGISTTEEEAYRLSGLVITAKGQSLAFIELSDGRQLLLREGDTFGKNGEVLAINQHSLRVRFPEGEKVLRLEGYRGLLDASELNLSQVAQIVKQKQDSDEGMTREVAVGPLLDLFNEQKIDIEGGKIKDLSAYLAPLLDLPPEIHILEIDYAPVLTVKEALERISAGIAAGSVVKLITDEGTQVYLVPHTPSF